MVGSVEEALESADNLMVVTESKRFWSPDFDLLKEKLSDAVVFGGRNLYQPEGDSIIIGCYLKCVII